ncbi:hypothetical protein B7P43_G12648 [Cryptotermes secundus]|uniref:Uncharacterized protein n=1 Tax=Cryptotermes secundus TaxID=105785 RepID=A0A2J7QRU8_9NEOP|nr:hypothetical protein B7P43_G12648 [Cryptotermes secundus]
MSRSKTLSAPKQYEGNSTSRVFLDELQFQSLSSVIKMPLRGQGGAEVIKPGLWSNGRRSFGQMSPPSHCFRLLAEFTSQAYDPDCLLSRVKHGGVQSWYGQPYRGILLDQSLPCKVTSLPMTM